jgi:UDP-sulfoquinovose synthase
MHAHDYYHQSKIADFLIDDLASDVWKLKTVTVQQATIYGATIDENESPERQGLVTRFNYDETFGTVINRFVCQIAIDHPLTVYGDGEQRTGTISLSDTIDNFMNFAHMDVTPGEHTVVHNVTDRLTIKEIVEMLRKASGFSKISLIENPRREMSGKLTREVERHAQLGVPRAASRELASLLAFAKRYKDNIDPSLIMPKVKWERGTAARAVPAPGSAVAPAATAAAATTAASTANEPAISL